DDFPFASFLSAAEVRREYERFGDEDVECDEPGISEAREEYVWWLKQCADENLGLVVFTY
ncbi:MAG: hypothetical protein ACOY3P_02115, partial [Planctomycetota bacterium]